MLGFLLAIVRKARVLISKISLYLIFIVLSRDGIDMFNELCSEIINRWNTTLRQESFYSIFVENFKSRFSSLLRRVTVRVTFTSFAIQFFRQTF